MIEALLAAARLVHYGAVTIFFGAELFPLYAPLRPMGRFAGLPTFQRRTVAVAAVLAFLSGLAWLLLTAANMSGELAAAFDWDTLVSVVRDMPFGRIWAARLALALVLVHFALLPSAHGRGLTVLGSGVLLASIALTGHTQVESGALGALHVVADGVHLLGAGAWLGALTPLAFLAASSRAANEREVAEYGATLARFSTVGVGAVAALVLSGLMNAWLLVGSPTALFTNLYGRLLLAKLVLFAGMLALAAANRFGVTPALAASTDAASSASWLTRLRRHILLEQGLGLLILALVSVLGTLEPAITAAAG